MKFKTSGKHFQIVLQFTLLQDQQYFKNAYFPTPSISLGVTIKNKILSNLVEGKGLFLFMVFILYLIYFLYLLVKLICLIKDSHWPLVSHIFMSFFPVSPFFSLLDLNILCMHYRWIFCLPPVLQLFPFLRRLPGLLHLNVSLMDKIGSSVKQWYETFHQV